MLQRRCEKTNLSRRTRIMRKRIFFLHSAGPKDHMREAAILLHDSTRPSAGVFVAVLDAARAVEATVADSGTKTGEGDGDTK
jgi:hypothetical protein